MFLFKFFEMSIKVSKTCLKNAQANSENFGYVGPSEVRALSVRRCRRAAWQTKWPLSSLFFLFPLSFSLSSVPYYFSPRRGCPRVMKICVCTLIRLKVDEKC